MQQSDVIIINREQLSSDIVRLTLHAPKIAAQSKPGQFVTIKVSQGLDPLLRRPFSIHKIYPDGSLQVVFKVLGKGTEALALMQQGQSVNIIGPLGTSFKIANNMCLIGGGLGIAPLLFLAQTLTEQGRSLHGPAPNVILAARNQAELDCFTPDFIKLGVNIHLATDDGSLGHHGLITDLMTGVLDNTVAWQVASCGPYPMMRAVAAICRDRKFPCQVSLETMMACGISACLGCAVDASSDSLGKKYLHVCQDGPVFWEGDIKWTA